MNVNLKAEIIKSGKRCFEIANALNWHPSKILRIINGTYAPSEDEKEWLARIIGIEVEDIFKEQSKAVAQCQNKKRSG